MYNNNNYESNYYLNDVISFAIVVKCINNLKIFKASGPDQILNEILKTHKLDILLYKYSRLCFVNTCRPTLSAWLKAIITPRPPKHNHVNHPEISTDFALSCLYQLVTFNKYITRKN